METLSLLLGGFATALEPHNLLFALIGCMLGTLIGMLPGIGPVAGTAILIPFTFGLDPTAGIIMLAAIYYGAMYGSTITAVLVNVPGEAASAITALEGYEMAKRGRAGPALAVAAIGSFIGGTIATVGLVALALPLTSLALRFGPPEYFAMVVVGLSLVTALAGHSLVRALISAVLGMFIAMIGIDPVVGAPRFTFGLVSLLDGIDIVVVAMGLFGIGEILITAEKGSTDIFKTSFRSLIPTRKDMQDSAMPILRGGGIGFLIGIIPGVGTMVPTILSYITERKLARNRDEFGKGAIAGVAGPEAANNACANAALIPLFTLGIPGSATVGVLMGALLMHGFTPGPFLFVQHPDFVWAVIASLYIGNAILLVLNLPLIPLWVQFLKVPYSIFVAGILLLCVIGTYSINYSVFDVALLGVFGILGYAMKKLDFPMAPMILTVLLTPIMEQALRQSLVISRGDFSIFVTRPISAALLAVAALFLASAAFQFTQRFRSADEEE